MSYHHRRHHRHCHHNKNSDPSMGCAAALILGIIAMPILGLILLCAKDTDNKALGFFLLIIGIIIWVAVLT